MVVWGSTLPPDLDLSALATALVDAHTTFVAGTDDRLVDRSILERDMERLREVGLSPEVAAFAGGHEISPEALRQIAYR